MGKTSMFIVAVAGLLAISAGAWAKDKTNRFQIEIRVEATKANGKAWDVKGGRPDIMFTLDNTRYCSAACKNSYVCTMTFASDKAQGPWDIVIEDKDAISHDPIGAAKVRVGAEQKVGRALVTIR